ncbi:DUF222 domain-containing protein [Mycolicibacterium gilvum]|uniref:DUF222 domain-containing protein n=1 Tax=Mycolicibacterium gilvum TaxID=1804 RepID=UPI004045FB79
MFDGSLPDPGRLARLSDGELIDAVTGWARASAAAEARKVAAIAELHQRLCTDAAATHAFWVCDDCDALAAQLSCALTINHGRALSQIELATAMRHRFPKVGAKFLAGDIPISTVTSILARTELVTDERALAQLDSKLSERAVAWGSLTKYSLEKALDVWVDRFDPDAVKRTRSSSRGCYFTVGSGSDNADGTTTVHGRVSNADAAIMEQRIASMARNVCEDDPRTLDQRRSAAIGAIHAGSMFLACACDNPDCTAKVDDGRGSSFVINVIADRESLDAPQDPLLHGDDVKDGETAEDRGPAKHTKTTEHTETTTEPRRKAALIPAARNAILPPAMLAELIAQGATIRFVGDPTGAEDHYRPSTALQRFIRSRDITCRFPGCDRPAAHADIDHTTAWPCGVTHSANCKCYCRLHHLIKTFWPGFSDAQHPDGTVVVTTPTGHAYTTKPLSGLIFPGWDTATESPPPPAQATQPSAGRHLKMPTRRRSRAQNRAARIKAERTRNAALRASQVRPVASRQTYRAENSHDEYTFRPAGHEPDYGNDPPPF